MVPADKASNNISIMCKKYYIQTLIDELDVFSNTASKIYTSLDSIVKLCLHTRVTYLHANECVYQLTGI